MRDSVDGGLHFRRFNAVVRVRGVVPLHGPPALRPRVRTSAPPLHHFASASLRKALQTSQAISQATRS
jgi:hypothetical protein